MAFAALKPEERTGLAAAVVLHAALVAVLLLQPRPSRQPPMPPHVTVNLVDAVGLTATGPQVAEKSQAAVAPELSQDIGTPAPIAIAWLA